MMKKLAARKSSGTWRRCFGQTLCSSRKMNTQTKAGIKGKPTLLSKWTVPRKSRIRPESIG